MYDGSWEREEKVVGMIEKWFMVKEMSGKRLWNEIFKREKVKKIVG